LVTAKVVTHPARWAPLRGGDFLGKIADETRSFKSVAQ
jgi:hypothetical protein